MLHVVLYVVLYVVLCFVLCFCASPCILYGVSVPALVSALLFRFASMLYFVLCLFCFASICALSSVFFCGLPLEEEREELKTYRCARGTQQITRSSRAFREGLTRPWHYSRGGVAVPGADLTLD